MQSLLLTTILILLDGPPPDGTPVIVIHSFNIALVVLFDITAVLGIVFAIGCLIFNFVFKNRKYECISCYGIQCMCNGEIMCTRTGL